MKSAGVDKPEEPASGGRQSMDSNALAEKIVQLARQGAFVEAEALREQLLQADAMALGLIVSTAEVIEEEKTKRLDGDHLAIWQELYGELSQEEVNCIFYSMKPVVVEPGKLLQVQGKVSNKLFFIDSGSVTVFFRKEAKNVPVIQLGPGDILGEDTFFGISVSSLSAVTQSRVSLRYLTPPEVAIWHEKLPGLADKCAEFCRRIGKSGQAVRQKNIERRTYCRYPAAAVVTAHLLDSQGGRRGTYFRGALSDISRTGICFSMKCSKQETARALLARDLELEILFEQEAESLCFRGTIVKVTFHLINDYSVHVRFDKLIGEDTFTRLPCDWSNGSDTE